MLGYFIVRKSLDLAQREHRAVLRRQRGDGAFEARLAFPLFDLVARRPLGDRLRRRGQAVAAVLCLRDLPAAMQTDPTNILLSDLLVGKVDDTASPPLARVDTVISVNIADMDFAHFQPGFPVPGSGTVAWSSRATGTEP